MLRGNKGRRLTLAAIGAFAITALASTGAASAGTVAISGSTLAVTAASGQSNSIWVTPAPGNELLVRDANNIAFNDGDGAGGCRKVGLNAQCPAGGLTAVDIDAGDKVDSIHAQIQQVTHINGGPGADTLYGGDSPATAWIFSANTIDGGADGDTIYAGIWGAVIHGGAGNDKLHSDLAGTKRGSAIFGDGETDTVFAKNGFADFIDCGANGSKGDVAKIDLAIESSITTNCEKVSG